MRIIFSIVVAVVVFFLQAAPVVAGELPGRGSFYNVRERYAETISEGVTLTSYEMIVNGRPVRASLLQVDLGNPYVKLMSLIGSDGTMENTQQVSKMAERTGAVAAVNGGFFVTDHGKPLGMLVRDGKLISSPVMRGDMPVFALDMNNRPVMDYFEFKGSVTAGNGVSFPLFGVNKLRYVLEDGWVSDINRLNLYDRDWGSLSRGGCDDMPGAMEAVVINDTVTKRVYAGAPLSIPAGGYVLWGHGSAADFISKNLPEGARVNVEYETTPAFENIRLSAGSNSFLVQGGKLAPFQENLRGKTSRTAVASADGGRTLYLFAVEKSNDSTGVEQTELAELLVAMGVEEAVNLDGGGSTTMVAKHLGDFNLSAIVQSGEGWQRPVPDGLGLFNTAPLGQPAGLIISGPDIVLAGTDAEYSVSGFDTHFHPWLPRNVKFNAGTGGSFNDSIFTAGSGGDVVIEATAGGVKGVKKAHIIGPQEIKAFQVAPALIRAGRGQKVELSFTLKTLDGRVFPLDARYVALSADTGRIEGSTFIAGESPAGGKLVALYQGLTAQAVIRGASLFADTEDNWANDQINELAEAGVIKGYEDGTFRPAEPVTRAQVVVLLARLLGWPAEQGRLIFKDEVPDWAEDAVTAAVARGIVQGYPDQMFWPGRPVTRAEVSVILDHAIDFPSNRAALDFKDAGKIPLWAGESLGRVVSAGILRGYEGDLLKPEACLTRAEMAVIIKRLNVLKYVKVER